MASSRLFWSPGHFSEFLGSSTLLPPRLTSLIRLRSRQGHFSPRGKERGDLLSGCEPRVQAVNPEVTNS